MKPSTHCEFSPFDFSASAVETPAGRLVHVSGSGLCPTTGWELRLVAARGVTTAHPTTLCLEIRELPSRHTTRASTRTTVEAIIENTVAERVEIRFGWREGFVIPVRTTSPHAVPQRRANLRSAGLTATRA